MNIDFSFRCFNSNEARCKSFKFLAYVAALVLFLACSLIQSPSLRAESAASNQADFVNEQDRTHFLNIVRNDFDSFVKWRPKFDWSMGIKPVNALIALGVSFELLDENTHAFIQSNTDHVLKSDINVVEPFAKYLVPLSICGVTAGILMRNRRLADLSFSLIENMVITGGTVAILKFLSGRSRPWSAPDDIDHFKPFRWRNTSMPSGHTALAFASATIISEYYPTLTPFAYLFAGTVGLQRIASNAHWMTDVGIGMILGHYIGKKLAKSHLQLYPMFLGRSSTGAGFQFSF